MHSFHCICIISTAHFDDHRMLTVTVHHVLAREPVWVADLLQRTTEPLNGSTVAAAVPGSLPEDDSESEPGLSQRVPWVWAGTGGRGAVAVQAAVGSWRLLFVRRDVAAAGCGTELAARAAVHNCISSRRSGRTSCSIRTSKWWQRWSLIGKSKDPRGPWPTQWWQKN